MFDNNNNNTTENSSSTSSLAEKLVDFDRFEEARVQKCLKKGVATKRRRLVMRKIETPSPIAEDTSKKSSKKSKKDKKPKNLPILTESGAVIEEPTNPETRYMIENMITIIDHHMMKVYHELGCMDFNIGTKEFNKDFQFANEALCAAILRTLKEEHVLHSFVDKNFITVDEQNEDKNKENIKKDTIKMDKLNKEPTANTI